MKCKYIVFILLLFVLMQNVSADTPGFPYSRTVYMSPWESYYDSDLGYTHLGTSYYSSSDYTSSDWTNYWEAVCDDLVDMHVDFVVLPVGTNYFASKRGSLVSGQTGYDVRYTWYGGDGWYNYSVDMADEHGISTLLWVPVNKNFPYDYVNVLENDNYWKKQRYNPNSDTLTMAATVSKRRFDYTSEFVRDHYTDLLGYALSVTPLDGVLWEEMYMHGNDDYPSYGAPSVAKYVELYGVNPLTIYESETVRTRMVDINEEAGNIYMKELHDMAISSSGKDFPDFVIMAAGFEIDFPAGYSATNPQNWSDNIDLYIYSHQLRGNPDTDYPINDIEDSLTDLANNFPDVASTRPIFIWDLAYDPDTYAQFIYPQIDSTMDWGGHAELLIRYPHVTQYYEGVKCRDYLIANQPPDPTYNGSQEQESSPINNPDVTYSNLIKKTSPNTVTQTWDGGASPYKIDYYVAGSIAADSAYRSYIHEHSEIPSSVTNATYVFTSRSNYSGRTGDTIIWLMNASNFTNQRSWSTNHTDWTNYTNQTAWGAVGGDWYDLNDNLRGNVPICSFTIGLNDELGTKYYCNITTLAQNASDGINVVMMSPNESEYHSCISFFAENAANSSDRPVILYEPSGANAPNVTTQWNNQTGDDNLSIEFQLPGYIEFGATANQTVDRWYWSVDDELQSETSANYTFELFISGNHTVAVYCENNSIVSSTIEWTVNVAGMIDYQPGTPENTTINTGIGYINVTWDTNKTNNNVVDDYLLIDEDTDQPFYTNNLTYNFTGLLGQEYNLTLYAVNNTNTTTSSEGYNFQDYPSINVTDEFYNFTSSPGKSVTIYIRACNSTLGTCSDWVEQTVELDDAPEYIPPLPISFVYTTGNFWVNYTWTAGSGYVTDSYNVSQNGTWVNGSLTAFNNSSVGPHGTSTINKLYAYNSSETGTLSSSYRTNSVIVPNNAINISNISTSYSIDEGDTLYIDADYTDADSDTGTFADNSSEWSVNSGTGIVSWVTNDGNDGVYSWYINVTDGYGSTDQYNFSVTVNDTIGNEYIPPLPISFVYTTGNFWVNYTWGPGSGYITDSYNVSQNGTWSNGTALCNNSSVSPHGTSTINKLYAYNSSGVGSLSGSYRTNSVVVPNNPTSISGVSASYSIDEGDTLSINANYSDIDSDTGTFTDNSSEWSVNSGTGVVSWNTVNGDDGVHSWYIKVDDGYGSTDQYNFTVTVNDTLITPPTIDDYSNSKSSTNMYPIVSNSGSVTFYASADQAVTTWAWYIDDVNVSNNADNLTFSWSDLGYKSVKVTAENAAGVSNMVEWNPYVKMAMAGAGDTISDMDEAGYDNLIEGLGGDTPDFELVMWAFTEPFQVVVGNMFFVILFGLPLVMCWIRQSSMIIPSMFGIILGTVMFSFMPASFSLTASAILILGILGTFYSFYKERR